MKIKLIDASGAAFELPFEKFGGIVPGVGDEILSKADPDAPKCYIVQSRTFCPNDGSIILRVLMQECEIPPESPSVYESEGIKFI